MDLSYNYIVYNNYELKNEYIKMTSIEYIFSCFSLYKDDLGKKHIVYY